MLVYLLQGMALGLPASAQPGPFQAYLLSQTMRNGWRRTLPAALAPLLSDGPILLLVLLILSRLPEGLLRVLQVSGGLFILYLAWRAFQGLRAVADPATSVHAEERQSVLEAALMNLLNPNPYIFWGIVAGPILVETWRTDPIYAVAFLAGFYAMMVGGSALLIVLFGTAQRLGRRVSRALAIVSIVALVGFGCYQLYAGLFGSPAAPG